MGSTTSRAKHSTSHECRAGNDVNSTQLPSTVPTMDSKTLMKERPTPVKTETAIIPGIPRDIIDEILDHLSADSDPGSLRACAMVSRSWVQPCQRHLFRAVGFNSRDVDGWFKAFPVPEESPAHHVRDLRVWIGGGSSVPEKFFEYIHCFTNVEKLSLCGFGGAPPSRKPSLWRLPQSITSLVFDTSVVTLIQVRDILAQLPNLENLSLSRTLIPAGEDVLPGVGAIPRGRFGGRLLLCGGCAGQDVVDMLLETPSGLRFTEMQIYCMRECLPSVVRLVEACRKTLVKLSHGVASLDGSDDFRRYFDFSKFPNLQEVELGVCVSWRGGGLPWIPMALSTLKPATSPHLSTIRFDFSCSPGVTRPVEASIREVGSDLQRVAEEVARIEREFEGTVNLTAFLDSVFKEVLDTLDILRHLHQDGTRS